jgi:EamA domain-containing membrane protein RarD
MGLIQALGVGVQRLCEGILAWSAIGMALGTGVIIATKRRSDVTAAK